MRLARGDHEVFERVELEHAVHRDSHALINLH
jgi:hypothetical protein